MATWLKQSTSVDVGIGPFLDETDGKTAETGLTITQPDVRLKKNNGNWAQKNAAQTLTHEENGWYEVTLDATDTNTLGILLVAIHESGALPVWREFLVVPANVYDSMIAGSDTLQADVTQFGGTNGTFASGRPEANTTHIAGSAVSTTTAQIGVNVVQVSGDATAADNLEAAADGTGYNLGGGSVVAASVTGNVGGNVTGSVGSVASGGITAASLASDTITAAKIAADAITAAKIADGAIDANTFAAGAITAAAIAADAITDAKVASDVTIASVTGAVGSVTGNVGGNVTGSVGSVATGGITRASFAADTGLQTVRSNTAQAGGSTSITLDASASATDDFYNNALVFLTGGTGAGQARFITDYNGTTKVATVGSAWATNPSSDSTFAIIPFASIPGATAPTAAEVADAVWDEAQADHAGAGTFGELATEIAAILVDTGTTLQGELDGIQADTEDIQSRLPAALVGGRIDANVGAISGDATAADNLEAAADGTGYNLGGGSVVAASVTGAVGSVTGNVGGNVTGSIGSLATQAKADVNAEVDTALTDIHLDHLLAADYDPASKPGTATALLNELVESDAGVSRFTANALEQAPSGGGGVADWSADERTAIRSILGIPASGTTPDDPTTGILDTIRDKVDTVDTVADAILADTGTDGVVVAASSKTGYTLSSAGVQAIWDALTSALSTASSIGKLLVDNINATISSRLASASYTAPLDAAGTRSAVGLASANLDTQLTAIDDYLDTEVAAIKAKTDNLPASPAATGDIPSAATVASQVRTELATELGRLDAAVSTRSTVTTAQVNAEVLDVLATDTFAEPAAVPAATASLKDKLGWLFTLARNKVTQTSTTQALRNDADSADIATASVSDNGSTFSRGEWS